MLVGAVTKARAKRHVRTGICVVQASVDGRRDDVGAFSHRVRNADKLASALSCCHWPCYDIIHAAAVPAFCSLQRHSCLQTKRHCLMPQHNAVVPRQHDTTNVPVVAIQYTGSCKQAL